MSEPLAQQSNPNRTAAESPPEKWARYIPGLRQLRPASMMSFIWDALAGLVLTAILIPAGMGYAEAAGLPAIYGLYATIVPMVVYAWMGPSRILVLGPDSTLAALIAAAIIPLSSGDTVSSGDAGRAVALAGMLAILAGVLCIVGSFAKLGMVTDLLSKPIRYGYIHGVAITVVISQLPKVLGFKSKGADIFEQSQSLLQGILGGEFRPMAAAIGLATLALILGFRRWFPRVPGILLAAVLAIVVVRTWKLDLYSQLAVVGALPQGLPKPAWPLVTLLDVRALLPSAFAIALVSFADLSVLSRVYANRYQEDVDPNQELLALGVAHAACGLFHGFPISASSSRTPVAETAGAKSQWACLLGAMYVMALIAWAPGLLMSLPMAALGAIVISACLKQMDLAGIVRIYRLRHSELIPTIVCFLGVVLLGVIEGIFVAIGVACLGFVWRAWRPYVAVLGRVDGRKGYHDVVRHPEAKQIPGLVLFRWDAPLFFANASLFHDRVLHAVLSASTPTQWVVVAAEPVTDIDITAADMLAELEHGLAKKGIVLSFAELKGPVKDRLKKYGMFDTFGEERFFHTLGQAVGRFVDEHRIEWKDWEER